MSDYMNKCKHDYVTVRAVGKRALLCSHSEVTPGIAELYEQCASHTCSALHAFYQQHSRTS